MNPLYLIFLCFVLALCVTCWRQMMTTQPDELRGIGVLLSSIISLVMIILSFVAGIGKPLIHTFPKGSFEVEKTPYRVILRVDNREYAFTDARTVIKVTQQEPSALRVTQGVNAWGTALNGQDNHAATPLWGETVEGAKR